MQTADANAIRRRRRVLYAVSALALVAVAVVAVLQLAGSDEKKNTGPKPLAPPVILERILMRPVDGGSSRGLAELVRHDSRDGLRVLAVGLRRSVGDEIYQLLLTGGRSQPKVLGNQKVGEEKTFV